MTNDSPIFDYWTRNGWLTITPKEIINVDKSRPAILVIRQSFLEEPPYKTYPGLSAAVTLQSDTRSKRPAETNLVSPRKKTAREDSTGNSSTLVHFSTPETLPEQEPTLGTPALASDGSGLSLARATAAAPALILNSLVVSNLERSVPDDSSEHSESAISRISISAWVKGWRRINEMKDEDSKMTEKAAFPLVFGFPYVKPTVASYKSYWRKASDDLRTAFLKLEDSKKASWKNFRDAMRSGKIPSFGTPSVCFYLPSAKVLTIHLTIAIQVSEQSQPSSVDKVQQPAHSIDPRHSAVHEPQPNRSLTPISDDIQEEPRRQPQELRLPSPLHNDWDINVIVKSEHESEPLPESLLPHRDLCPYCDEPMPDAASDQLRAMQKELESKSWGNPLPENPLHRSTESFTVFIDFCSRHFFEQTEVPKALAAGWPSNPDFNKIFDRVSYDYLFLAAIFDSDDYELLTSAKKYYSQHEARAGGLLFQLSSGRFEELGAG